MSSRIDYVSETICAPGIKYFGDSCISIDLLEDMITVYNSSHSDKIDTSGLSNLKKLNPITYKKRIVALIKEKMKNYKCDTQTCWLSLPFFEKLSDAHNTKRLHHNTFRPIGPKNSTEWLNTYNINEVFAQYENIYPDFKFLGAHPRDFDKLPSTGIPSLNFEKLINKHIYRLGFIFNLDKHNESGSHWVAMFADLLKGHIYYIDSVGEPPAREFKTLMARIKDFCDSHIRKSYCSNNSHNNVCKHINSKYNNVDIRYNTKQHQHGNSECGVYAISFILRLLDGETFDEIADNKVSDEEIQMCRASYFRQN